MLGVCDGRKVSVWGESGEYCLGDRELPAGVGVLLLLASKMFLFSCIILQFYFYFIFSILFILKSMIIFYFLSEGLSGSLAPFPVRSKCFWQK